MVNAGLAAIRQQQCDIAFQAFSFTPLLILTKVVFIFVFIKNILWFKQYRHFLLTIPVWIISCSCFSSCLCIHLKLPQCLLKIIHQSWKPVDFKSVQLFTEIKKFSKNTNDDSEIDRFECFQILIFPFQR